MGEKFITHRDFVEGYEKGELFVYVNKNKAGDFVLSKFAKKENKLAHSFWTWLGIILLVPLTIILLFVNWLYALVLFILGLTIAGAARKSAEEFVLGNMIENEDFWDYVLLHNGTSIIDKEGNQIFPPRRSLPPWAFLPRAGTAMRKNA